MRICPKCKINEITYKNPKTGYYAPYCKECRKSFDTAYSKSDKRKKALSKYNNKPERVAHMKEYHVEYMQVEENRQSKRDRQKRWPSKDPRLLKVCARKIAYEAKKCGLIKIQPCEVCGTTERLEMHHDDYAKPMDVRWLCKEHHKKYHECG